MLILFVEYRRAFPAFLHHPDALSPYHQGDLSSPSIPDDPEPRRGPRFTTPAAAPLQPMPLPLLFCKQFYSAINVLGAHRSLIGAGFFYLPL